MTGDLVFTTSERFYARWIRRLQRNRGEAPTQASHVAIGYGEDEVVAADWRGVHKYASPRQLVARYRHTALDTAAQDQLLTTTYGALRACHGYGWGDLGAHLADAVLSRLLRRTITVFRRLDLPGVICSRLVVDVYRAAGLKAWLPLPRHTVQPDDLLDYCEQTADWRRIN